MQCLICGWYGNENLCKIHKRLYKFDKKLQGFYLKKRCRGSRYTDLDNHVTEIRLTKIIEKFYGKKNILTGFHPLWAKSDKNVLLEYDILIKNKNTLIEYNGIQHYFYEPFFHKTFKEFLNQKDRDHLKVKYAKDNEYCLVVFKYNEPIFEDYIINKIEEYK